MVKKLLVFYIVLCILLTMVVLTQAADNKAKPQSNVVILQSKVHPKKHLADLPYVDMKPTQEPVIFTDDFEGTQADWAADASWNHVDAPGGGRTFQPISSWEYTESNSHSPTHSWHAQIGLDEELDFIVSPVIHLPTEVESEGIVSPLKGLKLGYWLDVDTPEGTNAWWHLVGSAQCWWDFTTTDPSAGTSSWYMEPHDIQHWRQWLITPEIDLTGAGTGTDVIFMHKFDSEPEFDYYAVDISTDNFLSYKNLAFYDGSAPQLSWVNVHIPIDEYRDQKVKVRFSSKGDYGTAEGFWAIDEIKVTDGTTDFFYDDGGEAGTTTMTKGGFAPGARFSGFTADGASQPTSAWQEMDPIEVPGFGTSILPGDSIRIAFQWESDGTATTGRGFFVDDVTLYGVGTLPYDVQALGAVGFQNAVIDRNLNLGVVITNVGLNSITATLQWNGEILSIVGEDTTVAHPAMFGRMDVTDFARDSVIVIPTFAAREWLVKEPGDYLFRGSVSYAEDGDASNNSFTVDFTVFGPPLMNVVYREDFEPRAGEASLEDFGFTVENGGGSDATGLNDNKWEHIGFIFGDGAATLSAFWGIIDVGPDEVAPWDSSEVLEEYLITPEIDISHLSKHSTLFMNYYIYWRAGYGSYYPYGEQWNDFAVEYSIDSGDTWYEGFLWTDYDSLPGTGYRLPNYYYHPDGPALSYLAHLGIDLTPAVMMGGEKLHVRFKVWSENSYFVCASVDNIVIYSGVDHARIMSVNDIPEDQGKQVRVTWKASFNDLTLWTAGMYGEFEEHIVTHYNLWRQIPAGTAVNAAPVSDLKTMLSKPGKPGDSYILGDMQFDFIATIPAHQDLMYNYVAPTLWDDVETFFMVSAHTEDPMVFVDSDLMSGTSIDNLAPEAPMNLMALGQNNTNILNWEASPAEDVKYYSIYRTETSGSYPAEPLTYSTDLTYTDENVEIGKTYFYVVTATDFGLNEGETSNEASVLTGVEDNNSNVIPTEFALEQNYPNPFNPATYINYQLPTNAHVTISIFNTNGQEIKTLVSKEMNAGNHTAVWDGTNNAGEKVSSGLYLYKIKAGSFTDIKKMMLLR